MAQSRRAVYEDTLAGRRPPCCPSVLALRGDAALAPAQTSSAAESLQDIRESDPDRLSRLKRIFSSLSPGKRTEVRRFPGDDEGARKAAREQYSSELWAECGGDSRSGGPTFERFLAYVNDKERELYRVFHSMDFDNDAHLSRSDLQRALDKAGLKVSDETLDGFFSVLDKDADGLVSFREWRDVLLLLPRQTSLEEIFRFYAIEKAPRHSASQVTSEGDSVLTEPERQSKSGKNSQSTDARGQQADDESHRDDGEEEEDALLSGAGRSFLAGGIAGAVSRTATAPFDRLKVYLINATPQDLDKLKGAKPASEKAAHGLGVLKSAIVTLYRENGWRAFFVGNGLNIVKIFPESAIKYASYETSKRAFAKYWDKVSDVGEISGGSRFMAGGIGGITSQLSIYWIETLKTRCMSSTSSAANAARGNALVIETAKKMWAEGGMRAFFRGLPLGLIGVFPYSAIDMSLYDGFRKAFLSATGRDDLGPGWSMVFGATSGGLGAASVYPLNLFRTRLQTQGTPAHPRTYPNGFRDVVRYTIQNEGWKGCYKGLTPTLLKVGPSVGISWAVFEAARSALFKAEQATQQN